jgi:pimeloyl-ACP methyl ester carboxylesterase
MGCSVELFRGFPLPEADYERLLQELGRRELGVSAIRVAHSLGSLRALAVASEVPTILMAPSVPRARPGRPVLRAVLKVGALFPQGDALAARLRVASYQRYGAVAPSGTPLSLRAASERLRTTSPKELLAVTSAVVLCSRTDPRHPRQLQLAAQLGATVYWVEGGHMFPVTHPSLTAAAIAAALT